MSVGLQRLRDDADRIRQGAIDKGEDPLLVDEALRLDSERRSLTGEGDGLRADLKARSADVATAMKSGDRDRGEQLKTEARQLGERISAAESAAAEVQAKLDDLLLRIPNPADPDVPVGGESASVIVRTSLSTLRNNMFRRIWFCV
ncbi:MAG: hypothetical protein ABIZ34_00505 [Candidatus Limnocylindrales bacterium]